MRKWAPMYMNFSYIKYIFIPQQLYVNRVLLYYKITIIKYFVYDINNDGSQIL